MNLKSQYKLSERTAAWMVHLFTASGNVLALLSLISMYERNWKMSFIYLTIAIIVDAVDGTLARKFRVKEIVPQIDGSLLDNIIDFITYAFLPAFFIHASGIISAPWSIITGALIVLSSSYQFCQSNAKTDDHYFTGFPSYWNIVALYLYLTGCSQPVSIIILIFFSIMIFVPIKYLYPSRSKKMMGPTLALTISWGIGICYVLFFAFKNPPVWFFILSAVLFVYYFGLSLILTLKMNKEVPKKA